MNKKILIFFIIILGIEEIIFENKKEAINL